jgi:hypothetical protein
MKVLFSALLACFLSASALAGVLPGAGFYLPAASLSCQDSVDSFSNPVAKIRVPFALNGKTFSGLVMANGEGCASMQLPLTGHVWLSLLDWDSQRQIPFLTVQLGPQRLTYTVWMSE